jgi:multidrug efflux pump subunit AcrB
MKTFNLTEWALNHRATVLFVILAVMIGGVLGFRTLGQLEDPKFSVPSMTVMVMWPGATAQQMQDEVLNRMEKKFEQLDHFDKVVTYARQGYAGMTLSVKGGTRTRISAKRGTRPRRNSPTSSSSFPTASSVRSSTTNTATSPACSMR